MSNWSSGLSRSASRWMFQVSASLGATLIAALVVQSLPRAAPDPATPAAELTSGGKFAARIASARVYDGLDTMPLPHVEGPRLAPPSIVPAAFLAAGPGDLAGLGAAPRDLLLDAPTGREHAKAARPARAPTRAAGRRAGAPADAPAAPTPAPDAPPPAAAATDASDDGLLARVASRTRQVWSSTRATTRDAWTATASAGSSLVSHLVPE